MTAPTLGEWLSERPEALSPTLEQRLDEILASHRNEDLSTAAESCIDAAAAMLRRIAAEKQVGRTAPEESRNIAQDLLTADALITLACELDANRRDLEQLSTAWAKRIASLANDTGENERQ